MNYLSDEHAEEMSIQKELDMTEDKEHSIEIREPYISLPWATQIKKKMNWVREETVERSIMYVIENIEEILEDYNYEISDNSSAQIESSQSN